MFNVTHIIQHDSHFISLLFIFLVIFFESGIPIGFFLPGDTLLFSAGFFASQGYINLYLLIMIVIIAKIIGSQAGYYIGDQTGKKYFNKKENFFFRKAHLNSAEKFYNNNGGKAVLLGQFVPVIRTFSPIVAGISEMRIRKFISYNILGAILWSTVIPILGYELGHRIKNIDKYILPIVIFAVVISFLPAVWHLFIRKDKPDSI